MRYFHYLKFRKSSTTCEKKKFLLGKTNFKLTGSSVHSREFFTLGKTLNIYIDYTFCFYMNIFYKKMSLKNPKTSSKCLENLQHQMPELEFLNTLIFPRAL